MIARRMAPIGWVAGVAGAALSFYLVSLQVASERTALERTERKIAMTQRQIRHLETEFSARASLRQLEAYNQDVLALAAPKVDQYLANEVQLASYVPGEGLPKAEATTALASAQVAPAAPARPSFKPAVVTDVKADNAPVIPAMRKQAPLIQTVAMITPVDAPKLAPVKLKPKAAAKPEKVALLDEASLGEIARTAAKEGKTKKP
jgi:hypothetical protein